LINEEHSGVRESMVRYFFGFPSNFLELMLHAMLQTIFHPSADYIQETLR